MMSILVGRLIDADDTIIYSDFIATFIARWFGLIVYQHKVRHGLKNDSKLR